MLVLVTGAFGHVGRAVVSELLERGHRVRAFDRPSKAAQRVAAQYRGALEPCWGDLRDAIAVKSVAADVDAAVHLAFVLPNASERDPETSQAVNVEGSRRLLDALEAQPSAPRFVFASSYSIYGETRHLETLVTAETPPSPLNHYTRHKVEVEQMIQDSSLPFCILRLGAVLNTEMVLGGRIDPLIFDLPVDAKQEFVHTEDAARALAQSVEADDVCGRTLLIGGGPSCQLRYEALINRSLKVMGLGPLPAAAFSTESRQGGGWMDTSESERLLHYQRWSFEEHLRDLEAKAGWRRVAGRAFAPMVRWYLVRQSPYLSQGRAQ